MLHYLLSFLAGYLIGSIPTAFLVVKHKAGIDIQQAGSGKVGAFNTFSVTRSKFLGILVGVLDALKGFAVVWIALHLLGEPFWVGAAGIIGAIAGHTYSPWLNFKGGRGLATTAGGMFGIGVSYTIVWCLSWLVFNRWKKDIVKANVISTLFTPIVLSIVPQAWLDVLMFSQTTAEEYRIFAWAISVVLLLSHKDVILGLLTKKWNSESR
ncbi:MAG: glycerol-3-phosphate acyltransferase [Ignavibacteriae bacterium]|nr:glycerol-3-phosphate acyltransferase [Ignavibacteriota bacterium]